MNTRTLAISILAAGALALAACGGGDESTGAAATGDATPSIEAFCQKANELQALGSTFSNISPNDIEAAKTAFQQAFEKIAETDAVAPPEIKPDVDTVATVFAQINEAVQSASSPADLQSLGPSLTSQAQELQRSLANVKAYDQKNCGA